MSQSIDDKTRERIRRAVITTGLGRPLGQGDAVMCDHPVRVRVTEQFVICKGCGLSSCFGAVRSVGSGWLCEYCWEDEDWLDEFIEPDGLYAVCLDPTAIE